MLDLISVITDFLVNLASLDLFVYFVAAFILFTLANIIMRLIY